MAWGVGRRPRRLEAQAATATCNARDSIRARRKNAFDLAFDRHDFAQVLAIARQLPAEAQRDWRIRIKAAIAALPSAAAVAVAAPLIALGAAWGSLFRRGETAGAVDGAIDAEESDGPVEREHS